MAKIDVDRHILVQLVTLRQKAKLYEEKYAVEWGKVVEVRDKTDAVLFNMPPCSAPTKECQARQKYLEKLKRQIFRASRKCGKYATIIQGMGNKQDALYLHLVSEIDEADTKKGLETRDGTG